MQLLAVVVPSLERLQKEGAAGAAEDQPVHALRHRSCSRSFRASAIAILYGLVWSLNGRLAQAFEQVVVPDSVDPLWFTFMTVVTLTAGTAFIMWLGERITENGIGNGISLIIFAGIVAGMPPAASALYAAVEADRSPVGEVLRLACWASWCWSSARSSSSSAACGAFRCSTPSAWQGRQMFAGQATYFPMKVNGAGVIPPIFAGALLSFPATLAPGFPVIGWRSSGRFRRARGSTTASSCC